MTPQTPEELQRENDTLKAALTSRGEWMSTVPLWAKVTFMLGPVTIIALGLVYMGARNIPDMRLELAGLRKDVQDAQLAIVDLRNSVKTLDGTLKYLCAGVAKTDDDRKGCFNR